MNKSERERWDRYAKISDDTFVNDLTIVMNNMRSLLISKRASYGPSNLSKFGDMGILVRTSDKVERLSHMMRHELETTEVEESRQDAWMDIAGYALLMLASMKGHGDDAHIVHDPGIRVDEGKWKYPEEDR